MCREIKGVGGGAKGSHLILIHIFVDLRSILEESSMEKYFSMFQGQEVSDIVPPSSPTPNPVVMVTGGL